MVTSCREAWPPGLARLRRRLPGFRPDWRDPGGAPAYYSAAFTAGFHSAGGSLPTWSRMRP